MPVSPTAMRHNSAPIPIQQRPNRRPTPCVSVGGLAVFVHRFAPSRGKLRSLACSPCRKSARCPRKRGSSIHEVRGGRLCNAVVARREQKTRGRFAHNAYNKKKKNALEWLKYANCGALFSCAMRTSRPNDYLCVRKSPQLLGRRPERRVKKNDRAPDRSSTAARSAKTRPSRPTARLII